MIQTRISADILATGIDQAIRLGAPPDMIARLRGAHAFASIGRGELPAEKPAPYVQAIPPLDAVEVRDE